MILIADSGSTKTDWCAVEKAGLQIEFSSLGYNPNYIGAEEMEQDIRSTVPATLCVNDVKEIYFYGAGVTPLQYEFVRGVLSKVYPEAHTIFVSMDLLASARALLGDEKGFAAILGTGTNSCLYDGKDVTLNIDSVGFIVGDEGSGGYLGKRLIRDFIRGNMPQDVWELTKNELKLSEDELIDQIYTKPFPNRFCAQYSRFIKDNLDKYPYFMNLVKSSFHSLFDEIVCLYPDYQKYDFNCVGSVAYFYKDVLAEVAAEYGMKLGKVLKAPMPGLVEYHLNHSNL